MPITPMPQRNESSAIPDHVPELADCATASDLLSSTIARYETRYGSRVFSKEVMQGVCDTLPRLLDRESAVSLAVEHVLISHELALLREEKSRLLSVIDLLGRNEASIETDVSGTIVSINKRLLEISGHSADELIGKNMSVFDSGTHDDRFWGDFWRTLSEGRVWEGNLCNRRKDGSLFWIHTVVSPVSENGSVVAYQVVSHDITELEALRHANEDLSQNRVHPVTGLPTRKKLMEDLAQKDYPTLAIVHVNDMIELNNAYGPDVGDNALRVIGDALRKRFAAPKGGGAYKLEGADFVVLYGSSASKEFMMGLHEDLRSLKVECG